MNLALLGKKVAILPTDGFEQDELQSTMRVLEAGATVEIISLKPGD